jgi:RNase P subunit RPR2
MSDVQEIPLVTCPSCGEHMRLAEVAADSEPAMKFDCQCGFEYRMSADA